MFSYTASVNLNNHSKHSLINGSPTSNENLCAICLQQTSEAFPIDEYVGATTVHAMIKEVAHVEFDQDKARVVCFSCLNKLIELVDFVHQIQDSLKFFQNTITITYFHGRAPQQQSGSEQSVNIIDSTHNELLSDALKCTSAGESASGEATEQLTSMDVDDIDVELAHVVSVSTPQKSESGYSSDPLEADLAVEIESDILVSPNFTNEVTSLIEELTKDDGGSNNDEGKEPESESEEQIEVEEHAQNECEEEKPVAAITQTPPNVDTSEITRKQVSCCMCDQVFSTTADLRQHVNDEHPSPPAAVAPGLKFKCEYCLRSFKLKSSLKAHVLDKDFTEVPKNNFGFVCSICGKHFASLMGYEYHQKSIHEKELRYVCPNYTCGKAFALKKELRSHVEVHDKKIKAYCDLCGRSFTSKNLFRRHFLSMHTPNRIHKCPKCPRRFVQKEHVKSHLASHGGTREFSRIYKCDECDKSYCWRNDLLKHKRTHQGIIPYVCHICDKGYLCTANLKYHYETVHDIDVDQM